MKRMTISVVALAMLASGVCGAQEKSQRVSSKDYGDAWPFTVDNVDLLCFGPSPKALARTSDGTVYALSGSARSQAKDRGWSDGQDITKPNPTMPSIKMDYSDIVQRAQALCGGA
ncbi:YebY family protein [Pseudomonas sp. B21-010]|uniref:YebY family protein n=1 Tax=Pseudomonas sp. B21-010 TaxID=2895471 RepID=UPI002160C3D1|nr:YebY family protein [Pseudomonas sp. B21-010]UVM63279.1 YebY family protein [Pseudomonas sp. B21-010]